MIIRLLHAKVRPGKQAEFKKVLEILSLPTFQSRNGMVAFYPGQPLGPAANEFVLVTVWKDQSKMENRPIEEWHVDGYKSFGVTEQPLKPLFQNI